MSDDTEVETWRRRWRRASDELAAARVEVAQLEAEAAQRVKRSTTCPNARFGRRHVVGPARAPGAVAEGLMWCSTCSIHLPAEQDAGRG